MGFTSENEKPIKISCIFTLSIYKETKNKYAMKKLNKNLRIAELADTSHRLILMYSKEERLQTDPLLSVVFPKMQKLTEELSELINSERIYSELEQADAVRDEALRNLEKLLKGYTAMPVEHIKQSAELLYSVFSRYGLSITRENYSEESAHIEALLRDLLAEEYTNDIPHLLGLKEVITALETAQRDFNRLRVNYELQLSEQQNRPKMQPMKKELLHLINEGVLPYLSSLHAMNIGNAGDFYLLTKQIISDTNSVVEGRAKKKEH